MDVANGRKPILQVENLETRFRTSDGMVYAVNGVSFDLMEGESLGVVGESGCGKSVTMLSLLKLIPTPPGLIANGRALFHEKDLLTLKPDEIRDIRGSQIGMIFQDPMTSLNPVLTIGRQVSEPLMLHLKMTKTEALERVVELLRMVGISEGEKRLNNYPHQFSGGMRQRVMIAMALACNPQILIADEPTTALDVTIQAQIMDLVKRLRQELGMSIIWITHDLGVVAGLSDRVIVMYAGYIIEEASVKELYAHPSHPYTVGLLHSLPRMDNDERTRLTDIPGLPPVLIEKPVGCPFAPRCPHVFDRCKENPPLLDIGVKHRAACWWNIAEGRAR
jgi:oligopeptide transport system ATP-binding protein